jgi:predicted TIM-barrel fold metal-dependent hydrolase
MNERKREGGMKDMLAASRRQVLAGLAAVSASAALPLAGARAQGEGTASNPRRIDVHHHILPPRYVERVRQRLIAEADTSPDRLLHWTPEMAIAEMDRNGVATVITSISTPGIWFGNPEKSRSLARACNDYAAQLAKDHPGRFGNFAAIPLPDRDGSLKEIEYTLDTLKMDGIGLFTSYNGKWLGDPAFAPVFEELNRRKAVVYVHPTTPACCGNIMPHVPSPIIEYLFDTTRAVTSLLVNGSFHRFPDIRFIFSHAGGTMPVLSHRIAAFVARHKDLAEQVPEGVIPTIRKLHFDVANSVNTSSLPALMNLVPSSQIMFGSDYPYVPIKVTAGALDRYPLAAELKQAIDRGNAEHLFPRFKA